MPGAVFLRGEGVDLRTVDDEDVEFLQRLLNEPRVRRTLSRNQPLYPHQEREWVESVGEDGGVHLLVWVDGDPVGTVGFHAPNDAWGTAELGYCVDPDSRGNGYATAAATALCAYAFDERRLEKLWAKTLATNTASRRVLEKVGFEEEGCLRAEAFVERERVDVLRYGLLVEEFDDV